MIQLRGALKDELSTLNELCLRSKAVWGYDDAFMTACRVELTLRPDELQSTHIQVAERDFIVVGFAQVKVSGTDADLLKLFVEPALLRSGVGRLLFNWATAMARRLGAARMIIERPRRCSLLRAYGRTIRGLRSFPIYSWTNAAAYADGV